ncbi:MAG TPA: response regulator [Pyrinomonadaceae bacterium]|nr:response regulator [Pyrinomonadaceae bacterium]
MLAGRKLLLADDSITIQKVVDLTFTDENVKVFAVGDGREAIEKLNEFLPDIVLADVFMPHVNGYELCEYIKKNDRFKHIPVMLLVGSFEPFDEAEARRVGADDTLTKPFQSIRRLIEKVGGLVTSRRSEEEEVPTAELPKAEPEPEPEQLTTDEIEVTTADTRPLPEELLAFGMQPSHSPTSKPAGESALEKQDMDLSTQSRPLSSRDAADELLDLGDYGMVDQALSDDFELDLEMNEPIEYEPAPVGVASTARAFVEPELITTNGSGEVAPSQHMGQEQVYEPASEPFAATQEFERPGLQSEAEEQPLVRVTDEAMEPITQFHEAPPALGAGHKITLDQLDPAVIDEIARRAVAQLSEKVVQEIAWEVVPELAELLIKRQLEEKNS